MHGAEHQAMSHKLHQVTAILGGATEMHGAAHQAMSHKLEMPKHQQEHDDRHHSNKVRVNAMRQRVFVAYCNEPDEAERRAIRHMAHVAAQADA